MIHDAYIVEEEQEIEQDRKGYKSISSIKFRNSLNIEDTLHTFL